MATSVIKNPTIKTIATVAATGSGTIENANGYVTIELTFEPPTNGTYLCETIDYVSASNSVNGVNTLVKINNNASLSQYRCVSSIAQTVTVKATRLYRI